MIKSFIYIQFFFHVFAELSFSCCRIFKQKPNRVFVNPILSKRERGILTRFCFLIFNYKQEYSCFQASLAHILEKIWVFERTEVTPF